MDFTLLKSFIAVAEEKSFSEASKHLFISQQSLSKQIAKLEEELNTPLFVRSRPLSLTQDGRQFLQTAKGILHLKQQYEENSSRGIGKAHYIHLGIEHTVARAVLPCVLPQFLRQNPDTYVKVSEESTPVLQRSISVEGVDVVIGTIYNIQNTFKTVPLCPREQILVVPKNIIEEIGGENPQALRDKLEAGADLNLVKDAPFIKLPGQSAGGRALSGYLKYYDVSPRFVCELTNAENAFQLANSGIGVFIYSKLFWDMMSDELKEDYLKNVDIYPLPVLPKMEYFCAYYNTENGLHGKTKELFDMFVEFFGMYNQGKLK